MSAALPSTLALGALTATRPRFVVWFRNDLRCHDNPTLHKLAALPGAKEVIPVFCFDPRQLAGGEDAPHNTFGCGKASALRGKFLLDSVADLKASLREQVGTDLLVGVGKPEELLPALVQPPEAGPTTFVCQEQVTAEEIAVDAALTRALKRAHPQDAPALRKMWSGTLYDDVDVKTAFGADLSGLPDGFTPFRNKVESKMDVPPPLSAPKKGSLPLPPPEGLAALTAALKAVPGWAPAFESLPTLGALGYSAEAAAAAEAMHADPRGVLPFRGGERAALARVQHYLWDADCLKEYVETRIEYAYSCNPPARAPSHVRGTRMAWALQLL